MRRRTFPPGTDPANEDSIDVAFPLGDLTRGLHSGIRASQLPPGFTPTSRNFEVESGRIHPRSGTSLMTQSSGCNVIADAIWAADTLPSSSSNVTVWDDSANGWDLDDDGGLFGGGLYHASVASIGGKPAVEFDASTYAGFQSTSADPRALFNVNEGTFFYVLRDNDTTGATAGELFEWDPFGSLYMYSSQATRLRLLWTTSSANSLEVDDPADYLTNWHVVEFRLLTDSTARIRVDGTTLREATIGQDVDQSSTFNFFLFLDFKGLVAETRFFTKGLSDADADCVTKELQTKYSLS